MIDDKATRRLRSLIERPEKCQFWGQLYTVTPRLISRVFGGGARLLCVTPLATRPNYFVVRVDSNTKDPRDPFPACTHGSDWRRCQCQGLIDEIIEAAEEEYGYFGDEDERDASGDDPRPFPVTDWGIGVCWGKSFPSSEWVPTPRPKRGRVQPQPRKGSIL